MVEKAGDDVVQGVTDSFDVVVIGGGAAGLSGALALVRSRRSVLVIDAGEPRNAPSAHVHNFLTRDGEAPSELYAAGRAEVVGYGGQVESGRVTALAREGDLFRVDLENRSVTARRLLVATGSRDELPAVPGVAERWGIDALHCPYCHGWEVRDQRLAVLAGSSLSVHQALMFRQLSPHVSLLPLPGFTPAAEQRQELDAVGIAVSSAAVVALVVEGNRLTGVRLADGRVVAVDAVVVAPRCLARADLLASLGIVPAEFRMGEDVLGTYVEADPTGATAAPGVWVAGNVASVQAQVIGSAAAGLTAGAAINADLVAEHARTAVAARGPAPAASGSGSAQALDTPPEHPAIAVDMVVLDTDDPGGLSRFYCGLLGLEVEEEDEDWVTLGSADGRSSGVRLAFQLAINYRRPTWPSAEVPQQYHLDLRVENLEAASAYAESLGATRLRNAGGESYVVFTDPSGHPFCLCR